MKLRILCVLAFLVFAFSSCEKINILDISTTYCTATINGQEYKDANKKYSGHFVLQSNDDIDGKHYEIKGTLKSIVAQHF
ncbi:MAG: hypothetical protein IJ296_03985 [Bacteroidales bacterium]|nr:hypothetical protein [Bacteroidales bacterium]